MRCWPLPTCTCFLVTPIFSMNGFLGRYVTDARYSLPAHRDEGQLSFPWSVLIGRGWVYPNTSLEARPPSRLLDESQLRGFPSGRVRAGKCQVFIYPHATRVNLVMTRRPSPTTRVAGRAVIPSTYCTCLFRASRRLWSPDRFAS